MKKVLSLMFALILIFSMASSVFATDGDKLTVTKISLDQNADVAAVPRGATDLSKLWDGDVVKTAAAHSTSGIVLFENKKSTQAGVYTEYTLTVELDKVSTIGGLDIAMYHEWNSMIGLSKDNKIKVEKSNDGTAYLPAETLTFEGEATATTKGVLETSMKFKKAFDAKFLKLTFTYGDSPFTTDGKVIWEWHGLTEIAVIEGTITSTPVETSEPTTPPTGDLYIIFAVAAFVSLAGAVVVTRKARRA